MTMRTFSFSLKYVYIWATFIIPFEEDTGTKLSVKDFLCSVRGLTGLTINMKLIFDRNWTIKVINEEQEGYTILHLIENGQKNFKINGIGHLSKTDNLKLVSSNE